MKKIALLTTILTTLSACAPENDTISASADGTIGNSGPADTEWVQIERLGRPAVNEGLIISNSNLNAFNSIPPTLDLEVTNPAILSVLFEASASLDLFDSLANQPEADPEIGDFQDGFNSEVVLGFLPDVMRIDTNVDIPPGATAYNAAFQLIDDVAPILTGGRKIEDDVVDITLSYLVLRDVTGATIQDNVTYEGVTGNPGQGHGLLHGQANYGEAADFPYLATPY